MAGLFDSTLRHAVLENACAVWVARDEAGEPAPDPKIVAALGEIPWKAIHLPELASLAQQHAAILVREDGYSFQLWLVRRTRKPGWKPVVPLEELVELAATFLPRTGTVNGNKMPVHVGVVEIHREGLAEDYAQQIESYERRGVMSPKVGVQVVGIDETSGRVVANGPVLGARIARKRWERVWERRDVGARQMADELAASTFDVARTTLSTLAGTALSVGGFLALDAAGAENGLLYGGALSIGPVIGAAIAATGPGIRTHALPQSLVAGLGSWALALCAWALMGNGLSFDVLLIGFVVGTMSTVLGRMGNTVATR